MTRPLLPALAILALILPVACQGREKTLSPAVDGVAVDVSTGAPVEDVTVSAGRGAETDVTDEEGRFSLGAVVASDTSIPLPASGVYRDTAVLEAQADGARAYGPADFISIGKRALSPVTLFLMGWDAPYVRGDVPESCELNDDEIYALQVLGLEDRDVMRGVFARELEYAFAYETWLDQTLVRRLPKRCDVQTPQLRVWLDEIDRLFDGLGD
ncbi:hypothetical protein WNY37_02265 [Henriciella sp. AS95]|uniref:hypothetical protein n=1 Tax=Henriciella sp. AS95 TaxID=3135782 RepID=UPI00316E97D9